MYVANQLVPECRLNGNSQEKDNNLLLIKLVCKIFQYMYHHVFHGKKKMYQVSSILSYRQEPIEESISTPF